MVNLALQSPTFTPLLRQNAYTGKTGLSRVGLVVLSHMGERSSHKTLRNEVGQEVVLPPSSEGRPGRTSVMRESLSSSQCTRDTHEGWHNYIPTVPCGCGPCVIIVGRILRCASSSLRALSLLLATMTAHICNSSSNTNIYHMLYIPLER